MSDDKKLSVNEFLELHGFTIIKRIGRGGFSDIYKVSWNQYPGRYFAAKVFKTGEHTDKSIYTQYVKEVMALKFLDHPNIIKFYNYLNNRNNYILIFEYYPNGSLTSLLEKQKKIPEKEFKKIARECLEALAACHSRGIVHLDIKPSNLLLDDRMRIILNDFGMATILYHNDQMTKICGSYPFLPPEMLNKQVNDLMKCDIWSLGVTFFTLLAGRLPFENHCKEILFSSIRKNCPVYPKRITPELNEILHKMLCSDPSNRPTALELLESPYFKEKIQQPLPSLFASSSSASFIKNKPKAISYSSSSISLRYQFMVNSRRHKFTD